VNLAALAAGHPADAAALHDGERWWTWGELRAGAGAVAELLRRAGVAPGDRVALAWPGGAAFGACYLGALAAGAAAVPLNPASPPPEMAGELGRVGASVLLAPPALARSLAGVPSATRIVDELPSDGAAFEPVERREADPAVLLYTSGTAGAPRPAVLSHGNLLANLRQMLSVPGELARAGDVGFTAVPLFHIFGLNVALGLTLATGAALVVEDRFDPGRSLELVRALGVTTVVGVPAMFDAWAELLGPSGREVFGRVRLAVCGAAALPPDLAERFERRSGVTLWQGYGLTEASPVVSTTVGTGRNRPGSVGRPLPGVELRLVDEAGGPVLEGDPGEVLVRGPNVFGGYWEDAEATAEVLTGDGWLRTGDIGILDGEGDLYLVDRRKDLVIVSGFNVYPAEVEQVLRQVPGVADAVVVGRPDPARGETVEAVVVRRPGAPPVTEDELRQACARSLARYKCPTTVRFVDELPRGLVGKALRRAVRDHHRV
jgi:long-chain acyl-CoA synthetase